MLDNCVSVKNPPPSDCDVDNDGYGNYCDADFDQNGLVGGSDFALFTSMGFGMTGSIVYDMDCNGAGGGSDFALFTMYFGMAPGPSGLTCAGMVPCDL